MKVSYLITVTVDSRGRDAMATAEDVDDYLTDVIYMPGVRSVTAVPVHNKIAKLLRKSLGF